MLAASSLVASEAAAKPDAGLDAGMADVHPEGGSPDAGDGRLAEERERQRLRYEDRHHVPLYGTPPPPSHGCGCEIARETKAPPASLIGAAVIGALLLRRRKRAK